MPNVKTNNKPAPKGAKKKSRGARKRMRKQARRAVTPWLRTIENPFSYGSVGIPDDQVSFSGKVVSEFTIALGVSAPSGTSVTHNQGIIFMPHPSCVYRTFGELTAGSEYMSDINAAGSGYLGSGPAAVPNLSSMAGGASTNIKVRLVSLGARVIYEGTELNRSAKIMAGYLPITNAAATRTDGGTVLSCLSTLVPMDALSPVQIQIANIRSAMINCSEARVSDGDFTATWQPSGVPSYQIASPNLGNLEPSSTPEGKAGAAVYPSLYSVEQGGRGCQTGQNALVILIEGDTTPTAVASPNKYSVSVVCNWEVVPDCRSGVAYPLTRSPCSPDELARSLNAMSLLPSARYETIGTTRPFR